eukprot:212004-Prorocentrum_minimum.AAC.1
MLTDLLTDSDGFVNGQRCGLRCGRQKGCSAMLKATTMWMLARRTYPSVKSGAARRREGV